MNEKADAGRAALELMVQGFNQSAAASTQLAEHVRALAEEVALLRETNRVLMEHLRALQEQMGVLTNVVSVSSGMGPAVPHPQMHHDPLAALGRGIVNGFMGRGR